MATDAKREVTEDELLFVEEALSEYELLGSSAKKCPWCTSELMFNISASGYSIHCSKCEFKVTVRGI